MVQRHQHSLQGWYQVGDCRKCHFTYWRIVGFYICMQTFNCLHCDTEWRIFPKPLKIMRKFRLVGIMITTFNQGRPAMLNCWFVIRIDYHEHWRKTRLFIMLLISYRFSQIARSSLISRRDWKLVGGSQRRPKMTCNQCTTNIRRLTESGLEFNTSYFSVNLAR